MFLSLLIQFFKMLKIKIASLHASLTLRKVTKSQATNISYFENVKLALASMAQPKIASSVPGQGTCLGCGPGPWVGACARGN